jgi:hypothetical protein
MQWLIVPDGGTSPSCPVQDNPAFAGNLIFREKCEGTRCAPPILPSDTGLDLAASWPKHLVVAVNLSPAQFVAGNVSEIVAAARKDADLEPHRLELEITETLLLRDSEAVMSELRTLKELGVAIVMDDFGTGYSSLSYFWRFPFDKIKIDRSFMQGFDGSDRDAETSRRHRARLRKRPAPTSSNHLDDVLSGLLPV